jgi:hypothetical protein
MEVEVWGRAARDVQLGPPLHPRMPLLERLQRAAQQPRSLQDTDSILQVATRPRSPL